MDPQCEIIGKYVLPIFRSMLAKELVQTHNLSQTETAKKLGTTQAAVSQYLSSKRAYKGLDEAEEYLPKIQVMAKETAKNLINNQVTSTEITADFCGLCSSFCPKKETVSNAQSIEYYI